MATISISSLWKRLCCYIVENIKWDNDDDDNERNNKNNKDVEDDWGESHWPPLINDEHNYDEINMKG